MACRSVQSGTLSSGISTSSQIPSFADVQVLLLAKVFAAPEVSTAWSLLAGLLVLAAASRRQCGRDACVNGP
jgi:hypothetical protein